MIPNDIEMIVMTKKDYDRNVEQLLLDKLKLQQRIDKAIEYIQKRFEINEYGEYYFTHTFDNSNMKELLEILGDKDGTSNNQSS